MDEEEILKLIENEENQKLFDVSRQTATRELSDLTQKKMFRQVGVTGKGTFYILVQTPQMGHKMPNKKEANKKGKLGKIRYF